MKIRVIYPCAAHSAYRIAAETFAGLARAVSGAVVTLDGDRQLPLPDLEAEERLAIIGSDAVNDAAAQLYLSGALAPLGIRTGTDDYCIRTCMYEGRETLLLAGGRPRAALYAVYRYFELYCGCSWFWDGDRLGAGPAPFTGIDRTESPRFQYRGVRYFGHRSLHRFQAEHWSLEDWQREIDWLVKKRFNLFMLRIGMDDLFQLAFPDIVDYPALDSHLAESFDEGYDDRDQFWSLRYRGELRRRILQYAFQRDLMHPEDCGAMTHWYSRTPVQYLEKVHPPLLRGQTGGFYTEETGLVWDIRNKENLENYFRLTQAHIDHYGSGELFHTIGLAERNFSEEREENLRLKLFTYHRTIEYLTEHYPNAKLLLASWDLWMFYAPEEVRRLIEELDPDRVILLDYTSDTSAGNNFTRWGVQGRFPWIFGLFSAYVANNEIRSDYELIQERTRLAKADPMCRGYVLWPELSHGDTFCGEYAAYQAWEQDTPRLDSMTATYCAKRYPASLAGTMNAVWDRFLPIAELISWSMEDDSLSRGTDLFLTLCQTVRFSGEENAVYARRLPAGAALKADAAAILAELAAMAGEEDPLFRRDLFDIARTVISRYINFGIMRAGISLSKGNAGAVEKAADSTTALLTLFAGLLSLHEDYSLFSSLRKLQAVTETNPGFERTLKHNADNGYCRSHAYELARFLYVPEAEIFFSEAKAAARAGRSPDFEAIMARAEENRKLFHATPLEAMDAGSRPDLRAVLERAAETVGAMDL